MIDSNCETQDSPGIKPDWQSFIFTTKAWMCITTFNRSSLRSKVVVKKISFLFKIWYYFTVNKNRWYNRSFFITYKFIYQWLVCLRDSFRIIWFLDSITSEVPSFSWKCRAYLFFWLSFIINFFVFLIESYIFFLVILISKSPSPIKSIYRLLDTSNTCVFLISHFPKIRRGKKYIKIHSSVNDVMVAPEFFVRFTFQEKIINT